MTPRAWIVVLALLATAAGAQPTGLMIEDASGSQDLVRVDVLHGVAETVGPLDRPLQSLRFDPAGRLFGLATDGTSLIHIDPRTASTLLSMPLAWPAGVAVRSLAIDDRGGFLALGGDSGGATIVYDLDGDTGAVVERVRFDALLLDLIATPSGWLASRLSSTHELVRVDLDAAGLEVVPLAGKPFVPSGGMDDDGLGGLAFAMRPVPGNPLPGGIRFGLADLGTQTVMAFDAEVPRDRRGLAIMRRGTVTIPVLDGAGIMALVVLLALVGALLVRRRARAELA